MKKKNSFDGIGNDQPFRELPNNLEAEQGLLGAILVNNAAMTVLPPSLETEHLHDKLHQAIFNAIKGCIKAGKNANPVTVKSFLPPDLTEAAVGEITVSEYLGRLASHAVTIVNAPDFASAIIFYAQRRAALLTADSVDVAGWSTEDEIAFANQIRESRDRLTNILTTLEGQGDEHRTFAEAVDDSLDRTHDAYQGRVPVGIDPGLTELMTLTGPWQNGQLIIVGGGVKQGKSALAMQSLFTIAEKHPVAVNSGEMSASQLTMREKSRRTGISATKQQRGQVSESEFEALMRAGEEMKRLKHIDIDCRRLTLQQIDSKIGRLISEFGIEAYFLDHLGKIQWTGKMEYEDEFKQGQRATSMLKDLAQKHNIPIVALTHLKKATFQDYQGRSFRDRVNAAISRRPTYRDLVGNMDKDADQVLIVFQPKPIVAGMEPGENTEDYTVWEDAMERVTGKADIILSLSRESEFPRRKEIQWTGSTTSYGPSFKQAMNERGLFA